MLAASAYSATNRLAYLQSALLVREVVESTHSSVHRESPSAFWSLVTEVMSVGGHAELVSVCATVGSGLWGGESVGAWIAKAQISLSGRAAEETHPDV